MKFFSHIAFASAWILATAFQSPPQTSRARPIRRPPDQAPPDQAPTGRKQPRTLRPARSRARMSRTSSRMHARS